MRLQFDSLAETWDVGRQPDALAPLEAALTAVAPAPARALDVGTGTGIAALTVARMFPEANVIGVDLSQEMLARAEAKLDGDLAARVSFRPADGTALPFPDASFDLVTLSNMIPFVDELARVVAPGGHLVVAFSSGAETPIYVPPERLREELAARDFAEFAEFAAGRGVALLARKASAS